MSVGQYLLAIQIGPQTMQWRPHTLNIILMFNYLIVNTLDINTYPLIHMNLAFKKFASDQTVHDFDKSDDLLPLDNLDIANLCMFIQCDEMIAWDYIRTKLLWEFDEWSVRARSAVINDKESLVIDGKMRVQGWQLPMCQGVADNLTTYDLYDEVISCNNVDNACFTSTTHRQVLPQGHVFDLVLINVY